MRVRHPSYTTKKDIDLGGRRRQVVLGETGDQPSNEARPIELMWYWQVCYSCGDRARVSHQRFVGSGHRAQTSCMAIVTRTDPFRENVVGIDDKFPPFVKALPGIQWVGE